MAAILIYKLTNSDTLLLKGRWVDGTWDIDKRDFQSIKKIDQYNAEMLLERFDGPTYFSIRQRDLTKKQKEIVTRNIVNAVISYTTGDISDTSTSESGSKSDFVDKKVRLANLLENDQLDTSKYSDEFIERIKSWPWYDG